MAKNKTKKLGLFHSAWFPFLYLIFFALFYYFYAYDLIPIKYPEIENFKVSEIFQKYSLYSGLVLGFLSMLLAYVLLMIFKRTKLKESQVKMPLVSILITLPWYFFARQLVYYENEYTDISKAIIFYIGDPLLRLSKFFLVISTLWLIFEFAKKYYKSHQGLKGLALIAVLASQFLVTGCTGTINQWACQFFDDSDHCYQNAAVQEANPEVCEKIEGADFADSGSNPPKDKCYKRIAENTGDLDVCNKIEGGAYSYTKEECILNTSVEHVNPSGCMMLSGADKENCISQVSPHIHAGNVLDMDEQIKLLKDELAKNPDEELQKQLDDLSKQRDDYLGVLDDIEKNAYESVSDPLNIQVSKDYANGKIDEKTKASLIALNDSLREKGDSMSEKEYQAIRDALAYKNDPKNDIENMDPKEIVKLRWNEKVGNAIDYLKFWNANPTATEKKYDEQLLFYQRMLERQAAIDKGWSQQQQDTNRELDRIGKNIKDKIYEATMEEAKKQAFGELMDLVASDAEAPVTAILGEAIDTVKKEAKSAEFRGLVRAYNLGMQTELSAAGGDVDKAHQAVIKKLTDNPYEYEDSHTFAHYQNLLQNKDCDGKNPHCINRDVFWKAMKKSYTYQNQ